jgi:hypothetical protein
VLAVEHCARGDARDGLQRLQARAREDECVGVAVTRDDLTVGGEYDSRSCVAGFDESAPLDDGEFYGILHGESFQHQPRIPATATTV